jgi:hypothetical protein
VRAGDVISIRGQVLHGKRPSLKKKKLIFHQDNAPAHKSVLAMRKLQDLRYNLLGHPDLAPSDFHLFLNLKKFVSIKRFMSSAEVRGP